MILFDSVPSLCQWHALVSQGDQWCHSGKKNKVYADVIKLTFMVV